jgi:hypothetical protein
MIAIGLVEWLGPGCTLEQILIGQSYTIYTPAASGCPSFAWQFVVDPPKSINGVLSLPGQRRIATLYGQLHEDDSFQITASASDRGGTADVTGQFTSQVSTIAIHGDGLGSACNGQTFARRLGGYFASQGGAFGGGGN